VLLIISGGIAAYKSLELIRELARRSISCRVILTEGGSKFVTPLSIAALSGTPAHMDMFDPDGETQMSHIQLSRSSDLVVVAPATADIIAKAAAGLTGDLATTALLATDKPILMAPAMNVRMWHHAATQANLATLAKRGVHFVGPDEGPMACGEFGLGRLAEPGVMVEAIQRLLASPGLAAPAELGPNKLEVGKPLAGKHAIVTAGPTIEPIDPVRFLSNRSSGKQGYAVAAALAEHGARVTLVSGPTNQPTPPGVQRVAVRTAVEMLEACERALPADIAVCVAAVADFRPETVSGLKLDKSQIATLRLVANPDILELLSHHAQRPKLVVGFAAQTHDTEAYAQAKRVKKGCDWIVANDVSGDVLGGDENEVSIIAASGIARLPRMSKFSVARELARRIADAVSRG
jgi:phosphopantothenoylcysteine decarboxylase / phosphopantothenate---cysteine ligase